MQKDANTNIQCSVKSCSHHCQSQDYCSLNAIKVSNCGATASTADATECASFDTNSAQ
jgi:hypothetical protein